MKKCNDCGQLNEDWISVCTACQVSAAFTPVFSPSPQPKPQPQPQPQPANNTANASTGTATGGGAAVGDSGTLQNFRERIRELANGSDKVRTVLFFGHSNSGKTWVVARVKAQRQDLGYPRVFPVMDLSEDDGGLTIGIPSTKGMHDHAVMDLKGNGIAMFDVEGEAFRNAANTGFRGASAAFLEAIGHAQGFVFVCPAGETLFPKEYHQHGLTRVTHAQATTRNDQILNNIQTVALIVRYFEQARRAGKTVEQAADEFAQERDVQAKALKGYTKTRKPALLLLSKADAFEDLCRKFDEEDAAKGEDPSWAEYYDVDPMGRLARTDGVMRTVLKALDQTFNRFRVDYVTASKGHTEFPDGVAGTQDVDFRIREDRPSVGVIEAMEWLKKEIDKSVKAPSKRDFGVAPAIWMRRIWDREFDKAFR